MKNNKTGSLRIAVVIALFFSIMSCSKNDPLGLGNNCETAWTDAVSSELNAYNTALTTYSNDPTNSNCANVKTTAKNYFDALGNALECVPTVSRGQINAAIDEAKAEVDRDSCD